MSDDPTEGLRRAQATAYNALKASREQLEARYGHVWDTEELTRDYDVEGFMAPYVVVRRKADGARGTLAFRHNPRLYFDFHKV